MRTAPLLAVVPMLFAVPALGLAAPAIPVVAAENVYGDVAQQIGGPRVQVVSILRNPDQDPHLFEASPSVARAFSAARLVIYNGVGYDPWAAKLLVVAGAAHRTVIVVAALVGRKDGDNPHVWYDPAAVLTLAQALADDLSAADPAHRAEYQQRLARFRASMAPIEARIAALRARAAGAPVTATEPVFGYMLQALGLQVRNQRFQLAVMNDTTPAPSDVAAFEDDLKVRRVRMLVYNAQTGDPLTEHMRGLAQASGIPVVGVSETEPPGKSYQAWMQGELDAVAWALGR
jgi:zinc/manganese transport system substrate-binding protein